MSKKVVKKKSKGKVGPPTKKTEERVRQLKYAFGIGCNVRESCLYAGISKTTYYEWTAADKQLSDEIAALREEPVLEARKTVMESLKDDPKTAMWFLERKRKDEFSLRTENINASVTVDDIIKAFDDPDEVITETEDTN